MRLNIKDPEARRLAHAIAQATGESMTMVVRKALQARIDKIERRKARASVKELLAIAERAAANVKRLCASPSHAELLYNEQGLPR